MPRESITPGGIPGLLGSKEHSDLTLVCEGSRKTFPAHKAILCTRSPVFKEAVEGFRGREANEIEVAKQHKPETVWRMLEFLYLGYYDDDIDEMEKDIDQQPLLNQDSEGCSIASISTELHTKALLCHVRVNAIADCYKIPALRTAANEKFESVLGRNWCAQSFSIAIQEFDVDKADESLLEIILKKATEYLEELIELEDFINTEVYHKKILDIMKKKMAQHKNIVAEHEKKEEDMSLSLQSSLEQLSSYEDRLDISEAELKETEKERSFLQHQLEDINIELSDTQEAKAALVEHKNKAEAEITKLKEKEEDMRLSLESAQKQHSSYEERIRIFRDEYEVQAQDLSLLRRKLEARQIELKDTMALLKKTEKDFAASRDQLNKAQIEAHKNSDAEFRLQVLEMNAKSFEDQNNRKTEALINNLENLTETFNATKYCRSIVCGAEISFNCFISKRRNPNLKVPVYSLQCGSCKCDQTRLAEDNNLEASSETTDSHNEEDEHGLTST